MHLTPSILRATYAMLDECEPFRRWNLPDAEDVKFRVGRSKDCFGWHYHPNHSRGKHPLIVISGAKSPRLNVWVPTMAHEMIHLHISRIPNMGRGSEHNAAWHRCADQVCKSLGFDRSRF